MAKNYESAKVTLSSKPFQTYYQRLEGFLAYPANGRSPQQLTRDYEKLTHNLGKKPIYLKKLQTAYVIGLARKHPEQAIEWAKQNITGFASQPNIRQQLFSAWHSNDPATANQWIKKHPELDILFTKPIELKAKVQQLPKPNHPQETSITLPR